MQNPEDTPKAAPDIREVNRYVRLTSLNRSPSKSGGMSTNFQRDYAGGRHDCIAQFEDYCTRNDLAWAHLFDEKTGGIIATYTPESGLTRLMGMVLDDGRC